jgi:Porin subfamily
VYNKREAAPNYLFLEIHMKLVKSLLLGSATALVAMSGANAADLGVKKPSAVEYVKVCNTYGAGFFFIPGSNTCLKVGGRVRAEYQYQQARHNGSVGGQATPTYAGVGRGAYNNSGFRAQGQIQLDARTATEYGTLRTFVRLIMANRSGSSLSGSQQRVGNSTVATGVDFAGKAQTNVDFVAFVQFAGLTAGRVGSFYDFYSGDINMIGTSGAGSLVGISGAVNLFAYTATFGSGFSATLSAEDGIARRQLIVPVLGNVNPTAAGTVSYYGGSQLPDMVANIRADQAWGSAQLSGVLHQVNTVSIGGANVSAKYGYAINGGLKINLPMLAAGDQLWLQASYAKGATMFTVGPAWNGQGSVSSGQVDAYNVSRLVDGTAYIPAGGTLPTIKLATSYAGFAGLLHYWTPTVRQGLFGGYGVVDQGRVAVAAGSPSRYTQWQVGSNVIWSPVAGLDIGAEVQYVGLSNNLPAASVNLFTKKDSNAIVGRVRVQRDF